MYQYEQCVSKMERVKKHRKRITSSTKLALHRVAEFVLTITRDQLKKLMVLAFWSDIDLNSALF